MIKSVIAFVLCINLIRCQLETLVYHGEDSDISEFSHSACLRAQPCVFASGEEINWICGTSILNQRILLTAAHCVYTCTGSSVITVQFGNAYRQNSSFLFATRFDTHEDYEEHALGSDIALVKLIKSLPLSNNVGRIAIYPKKHNPYREEGRVAGWGYIDELQQIMSPNLRHISQKIMKREQCEKVIGEKLARGIICGGERAADSYVSLGDSGSALVVRNYIQVGLVSYKKSSISRSIVMYTDVGYYYDWITAHSLRLYCIKLA